MQGVGREHDAGQAQVADHGSDARDLGGHVGHLLMPQDQRRVHGEGAEHMGRLAVVQAVEAAPQCFAVERHGARPVVSTGPSLAEVPGVAPEGRLQRHRIERQEQVAQGVDRRRPAQADAVDPTQPVAMDVQEGHDAPVRGRAREHG